MLIPAGRVSRSVPRLAPAEATLARVASVASDTVPAPASCAPTALNRSALEAGGVTVSPLPGSRDASPLTQISMVGAPAAELYAVTVRGSRSGPHAGRLEPYSQGDGASFVPSSPFRAGERVTVTATLTHGGSATPFSYAFEVATPDTGGEAGGSSTPRSEPRDYQSFRSRPDLKPPTIAVTAHSPSASPGELLLAPYSGPGQYGPMILDENGSLVWFKPLLPAGTRAADLRVQSYEGKRVLTWWQDLLITAHSRKAGIVIDDSSYRQIGVVRAGNGYQPDLHEFQITPRGTALITVYDGILCNLSKLGGPADGAVADTLVQEIDLKTGLVRYEWHSLDHVPLSDSYASPRPGSRKEPFDFFHVNSVEVTHSGDLLIDARNTWAAYDTDPRTGQVRWRLGGRRSSFKLGPGTAIAYQHDAREQPNGNITFFDNGATPKAHPQSRVIEVALNRTTMTATLVRRDEHSPALVAGSQGNLQALPGGDWMVGWGQSPYLSEYSASGQVLLDAHMPSTYESYRTYRQDWSAQPTAPPAFAVARAGAGAGTTVYASWNGATNVASWRVLAGPSANALQPVGAAPRAGFETAIALGAAPAKGSWVSVQALDATGAVLGVAPARRV
ncbi:MAG TPA: arylsulfotransferase family protein [Solirubrobacteraceae bacterium]|nr:arylsulfotransferase family protein [Solirubrobacteraceae bacterium]